MRALLVVLFLATAAAAQESGRVPRIGILHTGSTENPGSIPELLKGLRDNGYYEGRNVVIERKFAEGRPERLASLAVELEQMKVDVIVAFGPSPADAARKATSTIPIVTGTIDPVEQGLAASLARPGGNVTGWAVLSTETGEKQLALAKESLPGRVRVAVIVNPNMPGHSVRMQTLERSARALGLQLQPIEVAHGDALAGGFAAMVRQKTQAFFVVAEPMVIDGLAERIIALATQHRLPGLYQWKRYAQLGGLMSFGPSLPDMVRAWADHVHKILRGARPGDLPMETARKFELVLNLRTARELGITFPHSVLLMADEVLQ